MKTLLTASGPSLNSVLRKISETYNIPLSTLKFHISILSDLGLIEKIGRNGTKIVRLSKLGVKILRLMDGESLNPVGNIPRDVDNLQITLSKELDKLLRKIDGFHLSSSLTTLNILIAIFFHRQSSHMDIHKTKIVLSKGHAAPALYTVLKHFGILSEREMKNAFEQESIIQTHPIKGCPTIVSSSGSLGQGLSIANGLAIRLKMEREEDFIYVIMGDGELDEGQVWESMATSSTHGLDNIILFIDRNGKQLTGETESIKKKEPLKDRLNAFGWEVFETPDAKPSSIIREIIKAEKIRGWPKAIIVNTRNLSQNYY